jgi:hypothetical protein
MPKLTEAKISVSWRWSLAFNRSIKRGCDTSPS